MRRLAALLLSLALLPLGASEPIFRIKVTMTGRSGDASFSSSLEIGYAPCAIWTGGSGGGTGSPAETLEKAGGLAGLHKGGSLPFYAKTYNGSANGSDGSSADVMTLGPGIARWKERDKYNASERQTDATDRPDHRQAVRFTRTATGARITDFDLGVVSAGLGGYIGCANPYGMEIDGQLVVKFCSFEITNEELANWKHLNKTKSQTFTDVNGSVSVTAQLYVELEDPGEVDVEIEGYDSWIPTGNLDSEAKPGNTIRVKAKVHATGEPGMEADRKARIFFELVKVGEEPGVCANWPTHPAEKGYDLRILQPENAHLELITKDLKFKTKNLVKEGKL
ncbi:MAG: hypothetical protein Q8O00_05900, partial [Holophaga sp.]|nr:hypothetical protein [Holophaga sp.]